MISLHYRDICAGLALHALLSRNNSHDLSMEDNLESICRLAYEIGARMEHLHAEMEKQRYHIPT